MRGTIRTAAAAVAATCLVMPASAALASGDETPPDPEVAPAPAVTSTFTLPLLAAALAVDVTTDAGGGLVGVALTPTDTYTATHLRANHVAFENTDGTVNVNVAARHGGERVAVRGGALTDISGGGGWSGDVFGTGATTTVEFTIVAGDDGGPDITGVGVVSPIASTVGATERGTSDHGGETWQWAVAEIRFEDAGESRTLRIKAMSGTDDDGQPAASLKISLGRTHGRRIAEGEAVGGHTWSGQLCDGTAVSVGYTVNADGSVSDVAPTPEGEVGDWHGKTVVAFSRHELVTIKVRSADDGTLTVSTDERIRCDRVDPTVNTEVAPDATDPDDDHNGWGERRGDGERRWSDGDRRDRDGDGRRGEGDRRDRDGHRDGDRDGGDDD